MSLFESWLASPPPDAAIEISAETVGVAVLGGRGTQPTVQAYAVQPLPAGAVVPALTTHNVIDRPAVGVALRAACDALAIRPRRVALVIPDLAARVALVRFDTLPARREDLEQLLRWQLRKSAPFPVEDAVVTWTPGLRLGEGGDLVAVMAKRDIVSEYESVCDDIGSHAGLVDLSTLSVANLFLSGGADPQGDWLVVHVAPGCTSIALMRGEHLIFFRSRADGEEDGLADVVHQTTMYYQDRLAGQGFAHVYLAVSGRDAATDAIRAELESRVGAHVQVLDPAKGTTLGGRIALGDRVTAGPALMPLLGMLLRARHGAVAA